MAALKEQVKIYIFQALACMDTPQQVADAVKQEFNIEIDRKQVQLYDPTKAAGKNLSYCSKKLERNLRTIFSISLWPTKHFALMSCRKCMTRLKTKSQGRTLLSKLKMRCRAIHFSC